MYENDPLNWASRRLVWRALWHVAGLIGRPISRGSTAGIAGGALIGAALLGSVGAFVSRGEDLGGDTFLGPAAVLGALLGSMLGASAWPETRGDAPVETSADPEETAEPDPRWSEAVDHLDRFKAVKQRATRSSTKPGPPRRDDSPS